MAIDPQLLEILACPVCKVSVTLTRGGNGLRCGQCFRIYPIQDDIPIMLVEEAFYEKKPSAKIQAKPKKGGAKAAAKVKVKPKAKALPKVKAKKR
jgi:uncharacterized protein YbaR (Trm112 family)